jgi:hypothetical protein
MTLSIQHPATPGAYLQRSGRPPATVALRTDVVGFVGIAERGPIGVAVAVESVRQFQSVFGGYIGGGFLAYSLRAFFENGGRRARIVRVASDDPAQGAAAAAASVPVVGGGGPWTIAASSPGAWGDSLSVALIERSTGQTLVDQSRSLPSYAAVASTSGFAANSLVRLIQAGAPVQVRVLAGVDAARRLLYWLDPDPARRGPRQYPLTGFDPGAPLLAESVTYDLVVYKQGAVASLNQGLSLVPEAQTYAGVLLGPIDYSKFDTPPGALPLVTVIPPVIAATDVPAPLSIVLGAILLLAGGRDGVAALTQDDFIGDPIGTVAMDGAPTLRGLAAMARACDVSMLATPDILIRPIEPPTFNPPSPTVDPCPVCPPAPARVEPVAPVVPEELPPIFPDSAILAVQSAMIAQCEALGDRVALLDPPWDTASDSSVGVAPVQAWRDNFDSEFGGLYFPWLAAPDPLQLAPTRALPPSGHVAGLFAATDIAIGVHKAPANADLSWAQDVTVPVDAPTHGILNTIGVNVIRGDFGRPIRVMGARTVSSDPTFRFINVRRLLCMVRAALQRSMRWVVFEPNNPHTRSTVSATIGRFLNQLWTQGALVGPTAAAAFQVVCDETNNIATTQAMGQLIVHIALAPSTPFEFVLLRLGLSDDSLDIQERGVIAAGSG